MLGGHHAFQFRERPRRSVSDRSPLPKPAIHTDTRFSNTGSRPAPMLAMRAMLSKRKVRSDERFNEQLIRPRGAGARNYTTERQTSPSTRSEVSIKVTSVRVLRWTSLLCERYAGGHPHSFGISSGENHQHRFISRRDQSVWQRHDSSQADNKYTVCVGRHQTNCLVPMPVLITPFL